MENLTQKIEDSKKELFDLYEQLVSTVDNTLKEHGMYFKQTSYEVEHWGDYYHDRHNFMIMNKDDTVYFKESFINDGYDDFLSYKEAIYKFYELFYNSFLFKNLKEKK